jgi:hypothetical protein
MNRQVVTPSKGPRYPININFHRDLFFFLRSLFIIVPLTVSAIRFVRIHTR